MRENSAGTYLEGEVTMDLSPLDAVVAIKTDGESAKQEAKDGSVETRTKSTEVYVESRLPQLELLILEPDDNTGRIESPDKQPSYCE